SLRSRASTGCLCTISEWEKASTILRRSPPRNLPTQLQGLHETEQACAQSDSEGGARYRPPAAVLCCECPAWFVPPLAQAAPAGCGGLGGAHRDLRGNRGVHVCGRDSACVLLGADAPPAANAARHRRGRARL